MQAFLEWVVALSFIGLGVLVLRIYWQRRDEPSRWAVLTFAVLGYVVLAGQILPDDSSEPVLQIVERVNLAVLLFFPYFLNRLAGSFRPRSKTHDRIILAVTLALVVFSLFIEFPEDGEARSGAAGLFILVLLVVWTGFSGDAAVSFWKSGRDQPQVSRRRMRMLSFGAMALSVALIIAGQTGDSAVTDALIQLIALASVTAFFFGFSPPSWLRTLWRKPVEDSLRRGTLEMMRAESTTDVLNVLLPHALGIVGGKGVAVLDKTGEVVGSQGVTPAEMAKVIKIEADAPSGSESASGLVHLEFPFGAIVVQTSVTTPFFGQDELDLLKALGALSNLAMERVVAGDLKMQLEKASLRRKQALEINDNIVQGLAVAKYSFDLKQHEKAREAIEGTLVAARSIISELLDDVGGEMDFAPGSLTRGYAATGFMDSSITQDRHREEDSA